MDYQYLIEFGAGCATFAYVFSRVIDYGKARMNAVTRQKQFGAGGNFQGISALIQNIDSAIDQDHKLRQQLIASGAAEEQLKPIDSRLKKMEWVRANKTWLQYVGPYGDQIAGGVLKMLARVTK